MFVAYMLYFTLYALGTDVSYFKHDEMSVVAEYQECQPCTNNIAAYCLNQLHYRVASQ
jgi:hypothetical protein